RADAEDAEGFRIDPSYCGLIEGVEFSKATPVEIDAMVTRRDVAGAVQVENGIASTKPARDDNGAGAEVPSRSDPERLEHASAPGVSIGRVKKKRMAIGHERPRYADDSTKV